MSSILTVLIKPLMGALLLATAIVAPAPNPPAPRSPAPLAGALDVSPTPSGLLAGTPHYEVLKVSDLDFGMVAAGTRIDLRHSDQGAAKFRIRRIDGSARLRVQLVLPSGTCDPSSECRLTFPEGSAAWGDHDDLAGRHTFDPKEILQLTIPRDNDLYIWLGGRIDVSTVAPSLSDPTDILLTVTAD